MTFKKAFILGIFIPLALLLINALIIFTTPYHVFIERVLGDFGYLSIITLFLIIPYCFFIAWLVYRTSNKTTEQLKRYSLITPFILMLFSVILLLVFLFVVPYGDHSNLLNTIGISALISLVIGVLSVAITWGLYAISLLLKPGQ